MKWQRITDECSPNMPRAGCRILFLQTTEAGGYPPIIHASSLMALAGWEVMILNAPVMGHSLSFPAQAGVVVRNIHTRPSHVMGRTDYLRYFVAAARLALMFRPDVVYASDPLGAGPGLIAARLAKAALVYHEHDTPRPGTLRSRIAQFRTAAAQRAHFVIFPNAARARIAQADLGFRDEQLRVVWNAPRRAELPAPPPSRDRPVIALYHGSITPERLPESVVKAVAQSQCKARLRIIGYEAPGAAGYMARLLEIGRRFDPYCVEYAGQVSRDRLLAEAAQATIGLALLPKSTSDVNLKYMIGASNKVFDYMAAGLALLLPDAADWRSLFVTPGYGRCCDPADSASIAAQLDWFAGNPTECRTMGIRGRAKIEADWNYETFFNPILMGLNTRTRSPDNPHRTIDGFGMDSTAKKQIVDA
jgi:glycosyltransferase involved in cell wall biosynthesis